MDEKEYKRQWAKTNSEKMKRYRRKWVSNNQDKVRALRRHKFGISVTETEYQSKLEEQGGKCAICGLLPTSKRRLAVDHNHNTGKIRGLLCHRCNIAIGGMNESVEILQAAINYLEKWSA